MTVSHVEVLVEEPSAEAALRILLPRMLGEATFDVHAYSCKDALLKRLPERLSGYASWIPKDWRIVVVVDRDDDDCAKLKKRLEAMAGEAGLATTSSPSRWSRTPPSALLRLFNGEDLKDWHNFNANSIKPGGWQIADGALACVDPLMPAISPPAGTSTGT